MERTPRSCRAIAPVLAIALLVALTVTPGVHAARGAATSHAATAWALPLPAWLTSWLEPLTGWFSTSTTSTASGKPAALYDRAGSSVDPDGTPSETSTVSTGPISLTVQPDTASTL